MVFIRALRRFFLWIASWPEARWSMVVAVCALVLSIMEFRDARWQERASVRPRLFISFFYDKTGDGWLMSNVGFGPARMRGFKVLIDGVPQKATNHFPDVLVPFRLPQTEVGFLNPQVGEIIKDGLDNKILWLSAGPGAETIHAEYERIMFEVCYCSMYDECWEFTGAKIEGKRDDSCSDFSGEPHSLWWDG